MVVRRPFCKQMKTCVVTDSETKCGGQNTGLIFTKLGTLGV